MLRLIDKQRQALNLVGQFRPDHEGGCSNEGQQATEQYCDAGGGYDAADGVAGVSYAIGDRTAEALHLVEHRQAI